MIYQVKDLDTDEVKFTANYPDEIDDFLFHSQIKNYYITKIHTCRGSGCDLVGHERHDAYGISTGYWCHDCYENRYPYRKDRYPTIEHDGYGERLDDDY